MTTAHPPLPTTRPRLALLKALRDVAAVGTTDPTHASRQVELYDLFAHWNREVFADRLMPVHCNVALTPYGHTIGLCHYNPVQFIEIHPACWDGHADHHAQWTDGSGVSGVMLHEMIHLACSQAGQDPDHKGAPWAAWCDFIGQYLGLPLTYVQHSRRKASTTDGRRVNVWVPTVPTEPRPSTRLASYAEIRSFPSVIEGDGDGLPRL